MLEDDDNTYKLIEDMVASVAENFSCRTLNIGMDEAMLIGAGAYFNKHGYVSRYEILIKHLRRVREICAKHGFRIKMWSDMFFRHWFEGKYYAIEEPMPKIKKGEIPEDIELIYWDYYHTESKEYKAMADKHAAIGCRTGFAGGAWKWSGFAPVNYFSLRAVRAAIPAIAGRVDDLMLTAWGDNGAECSVFAVMPVAAVYAEGAYGGAVDEGKEPRELFRAVMGLSFDDFVKLDCANRLGENWGEEPTSCSKYYLYNDPLMGIFDSFLIEGTAEQFAENAALLSAIADKAGEWAYLFRNLAGLCELLTIKADLGQRLKDAYDAKDLPRLKALADKDIADCLILLDTFVAGFETHWMTENKPFGFEVQHYRLGGLNSRLLYVQKVVREFVAGKRTEIPELKEARLDFMGKARTFSKEKQINFNYFAYTVSPGTL